MWNPVLTLYMTLITLIYGAEKPVVISPEIIKLCHAILYDDTEEIEALLQPIGKDIRLPDGSKLIQFAIQCRAYNTCIKLAYKEFPFDLKDLELIRWMQLLESKPEKQQAASECITLFTNNLTIQGILSPEIIERCHKKNIQALIAQRQSVHGQLHKAVIDNNIKEIITLLETENADPNFAIGHITPIELAIAHFHPDALKCLLQTRKVYATQHHLKQIQARIELLSACEPGIDVTFQNLNEQRKIHHDAQQIKEILQANHQLINQILDNEKFH